MKMNFKVFGFSLLFILGMILAFSPIEKMSNCQMDINQLLNELQHSHYYISPDDLAAKIIDKEPGFVVVDIRSKEDFDKYHIPNSLHVPVKDILTNEDLKNLQEDNNLILVSNGNTLASQVWLLLKENNFKDVYVLQGGMNHWVDVFAHPQKPTGTFTDEELFRYEFRKAAGPVMMGSKIAAGDTKKKERKISKPVFRAKKKKKPKLDEGC